MQLTSFSSLGSCFLSRFSSLPCVGSNAVVITHGGGYILGVQVVESRVRKVGSHTRRLRGMVALGGTVD